MRGQILAEEKEDEEAEAEDGRIGGAEGRKPERARYSLHRALEGAPGSNEGAQEVAPRGRSRRESAVPQGRAQRGRGGLDEDDNESCRRSRGPPQEAEGGPRLGSSVVNH